MYRRGAVVFGGSWLEPFEKQLERLNERAAMLAEEAHLRATTGLYQAIFEFLAVYGSEILLSGGTLVFSTDSKNEVIDALVIAKGKDQLGGEEQANGGEESNKGQQSNGGTDNNGGFSPWGPTLIGLGQPLDFLKPVGAAGSQRGSSIASWGLDKILNKASKATGKNLSHFPKQAFTGWKLKTGTEFGLRRTATTSVGRFAGRWIPFVGWGIFAYDIYDNRKAIGQWIDEQQRINEANKNTPYWNICFEKGTLIYGSNGLIPIENINVGDSVYSYNLQTNTTELSKVANTFRRETVAIYELTFNNRTVYVTAEHPFYIIGKGWVKVKDLKAGDELQSSVKEKSVKITSVILQERSVMVYNIEVGKNHNYFVSDDKILVHNKSIEDFEEEPVSEEENENIIDKH